MNAANNASKGFKPLNTTHAKAMNPRPADKPLVTNPSQATLM